MPPVEESTQIPNTPAPVAVAPAQTVTPPVEAPAPQNTPAPAPATQAPTDAEAMLSDFESASGTPAQQTATPPATEGTTQPPAATTPNTEDDLPDPATIRSRNHYLKAMQAIQVKRDELKAEEARILALQADATKTVTPPPAEQPGAGQQTTTPLLSELLSFKVDPELYAEGPARDLASHTAALQQAVSGLVEVNKVMYNEVQQLRGTASQFTSVQQEAKAQVVMTMVGSAAKEIETKYGLAATQEEIATSLAEHAPTLARRNGGVLPPDAALRAWLMDNGESLMAAQQQAAPKAPATVTPPAKTPAAPPAGGGGSPRPNANQSDDEKMLADIQAALQVA